MTAACRKTLYRRLFQFLVAGVIAFNLLCIWHARMMLVYATGAERASRPEALQGWAKARVLVTGISVPRPENFATPADQGMHYDTVVLPMGKDGFLEAWHIRSGRSNDVVLLFAGYSSCKAALLAEARIFHDWGWDVWMADFRGSGGSSGHDTTLGYRESEDVARLFQHVQSQQQPSRIVLYGSSMGSAAILRAVAREDIQPDGVIAESAFDTMLNVVRNRFHAMRLPPTPAAEFLTFWGGIQQGFNAFAHNPSDYSAKLHAPLLLLHGEQDPRATLTQARHLQSRAAGPTQLVVFPQAGHTGLLHKQPGLWTESVKSWLFALPSQP